MGEKKKEMDSNVSHDRISFWFHIQERKMLRKTENCLSPKRDRKMKRWKQPGKSNWSPILFLSISQQWKTEKILIVKKMIWEQWTPTQISAMFGSIQEYWSSIIYGSKKMLARWGETGWEGRSKRMCQFNCSDSH
jgi:hypothetical protein